MAATATAQVLLPSNQEITDSTTTAQAICAVDAGNYSEVSVHVTTQGGSSTITFQVSNDNINWVSCTMQPSTSIGTVAVTTTTTTGIWRGPLMGRYFRLNVTGIASGTTTAIIELVPTSRTPTALAVTAIGSGNYLVLPATPTTFNLTAAGTTNATSIKASAGTAYNVVVTNIAAAARFVKLYDKASAPTVGTDIPIVTIPLATAPGFVNVFFGPQGKRFTAGIALATTVAQIDTDVAAVTAGDLKISLDYI